MKKILATLIVMVSTGWVTGCLWPTSGYVEISGPEVEYGYQPVLYDGYVVYYADGGVPFIWMNGAQLWIPSNERPYYVNHYQRHRDSYLEWNRYRGQQYRERRYPNSNRDRHHLEEAQGRQRVYQQPQQPAENREHHSQPAESSKQDREQKHERRPELEARPLVQPQPMSKPASMVEPKSKPHPKMDE